MCATDFAPWASGEPNDYQGNEDCDQIWADGVHFNDNSCAARQLAKADRLSNQ